MLGVPYKICLIAHNLSKIVTDAVPLWDFHSPRGKSCCRNREYVDEGGGSESVKGQEGRVNIIVAPAIIHKRSR